MADNMIEILAHRHTGESVLPTSPEATSLHPTWFCSVCNRWVCKVCHGDRGPMTVTAAPDCPSCGLPANSRGNCPDGCGPVAA